MDEVVEAEVEETVEEKAKEKVLEEKAVGAGQWRRVFGGAREAGSIQDLPLDPAVLAGPHPPNLDTPLFAPPPPPGPSDLESPFFDVAVHHKMLGQRRWV